jgi:mono/diheme cytochrome c family protein
VFSNSIKHIIMKHRFLYVPVIAAVIFSACTDIHKVPDKTGVPADTTAKTEDPAIAAGQRIFEEKCVACHGSDGTAGIANAANLQLSKLDKATLAHTVSNGRGGMPAFKAQLTEAEIDHLADYLIILRK